MSGERRPSGGTHGQNGGYFNGGGRGNAERGGTGGGGPRGGNRRGGQQQAPKAWISGARLVAYDVLRDVEERDAYANLALPAKIRAANLDARDAALATELTSGTLRGQGRYDRIIELAANRPIADIDPRTRNVLRLGVHQLRSMRVGAHAAVNESVELQRRVAVPQGAGFVNGVLRTVGRADPAEWDDRINDEAASADESLAQRSSHPVWVLRALRAALTAEGRADELGALLEADNLPPRVSVAALPGQGFDADDETLEHAGLRASGPSPIGFELAGGDPISAIKAAGAADGTVRVQDQGSQLAALLLTRAKPVVPGERWLDLCAGPGGKTAVLAADALRSGATLDANEVSPARAGLVRRAVAGVPLTVPVSEEDGRERHINLPGAYDRVLVDAPCTGLGALRRRPEARWRKQPGDIPELAQLQQELFLAGFEALAPGGVLAYVTCSPHLAETTSVVAEARRVLGDAIEPIDTATVIRRVAASEIDVVDNEADGHVQLWPHRQGTDAMFISLFRKVDSNPVA